MSNSKRRAYAATNAAATAALRHALLSYLLGAVILATTINLVSGLLR